VKLLGEFEEFMNDDFNTAKVLANMFEIIPHINSIKDGLIPVNTFSSSTIQLLQNRFKSYIEDVFGLKGFRQDDGILDNVMQLLIDIRKDARSKKDFATSDKIRSQLKSAGILLKDKKNGEIEWELS
jgi:cysteinyl-tRNA synthetase